MIMCFFNAYIKIKILIISGSPRPRENTKIALDEMVKIFDQEDIESEIEHVGNKDIRGCIACISCKARLGHCVFDDCANAILVAFLYNTSFDKNDEGWNFMAIFGKKLSLDSFFCITDSYSKMIY